MSFTSFLSFISGTKPYIAKLHCIGFIPYTSGFVSLVAYVIPARMIYCIEFEVLICVNQSKCISILFLT